MKTIKLILCVVTLPVFCFCATGGSSLFQAPQNDTGTHYTHDKTWKSHYACVVPGGSVHNVLSCYLQWCHLGLLHGSASGGEGE